MVKHGGGLGIYTKDSIDVDPSAFKQLNVSNATIELQWVVITRPNTKKILLGNVYRPPDGHLSDAFRLISTALDQINDLPKFEVLVMGDFNADNLDKSSRAYRRIKGFETEHQLQQMIDKPTRFSHRAHTIIDLAFTNMKHCTGSGVINYNISDHKLIYVLKKKVRNCKAVETRLGRSYANFTPQTLADALERIDTGEILACQDPDECWGALERVLYRVADELCPVKELKIRVHTEEYLTRDLLDLQNDRDYFSDKADWTKDPCDKFIAKCLTSIAKAAIDKARAAHNKMLIEQHGQNSKKYWDKIEGAEPKANARINGIVDDATGEKIPDVKLPERINDFFAGIGARLTGRFPTIHNDDKTFKPQINPQVFDLQNVNKYDLLFKMDEMSSKKSSGMDNISSVFVMAVIKVLIVEFTHLFNITLGTGVYPQAWKVATVTPIPKIPHPRTCGDLRPISILPLPGRLLEKIINANITNHLEKCKYLANQQNGFRRNRSTTRTLATLVDRLSLAIDQGEFAVTVFLDFKKAFDTVDHEILIWKLERAGVGPGLCRLLANYLTGRMQATKVNRQVSASKPVSTGVPQGSTLGPLLFIIFTNDLVDISDIPLYTIYADDTTVTVVHKDLETIERVLNLFFPLLSEWCVENKLTLNPQKTEYMIFGSRIRLKKSPSIHLSLGGDLLREVSAYKYLGTALDQTLSGVNQLTRLTQLISQRLISFRRIRRSLSERTAIVLYKATILPIFDYNDIIYNLLNKQQLAKLQRLQNRALRLVFCSRTLSVSDMHNRATVEYLEQRRENHLLALMFIRTWEDEYRDDNPRITRRADAVMLKVPRARTTKLTKAPILMGSKIWNDLPPEVRNAKTKLELKCLIKRNRTGQPLNWEEDPDGANGSIM